MKHDVVNNAQDGPTCVKTYIVHQDDLVLPHQQEIISIFTALTSITEWFGI